MVTILAIALEELESLVRTSYCMPPSDFPIPSYSPNNISLIFEKFGKNAHFWPVFPYLPFIGTRCENSEHIFGISIIDMSGVGQVFRSRKFSVKELVVLFW